MDKCPECNGKGVVSCPVDYGGDDFEAHPDSCRVCGGDSRVRVTCPECDGSGKDE